jgi:hypothetical protein
MYIRSIQTSPFGGWPRLATGIERGNGAFQCRPWRDDFEFGKEAITSGQFLLGGVFQCIPIQRSSFASQNHREKDN